MPAITRETKAARDEQRRLLKDVLIAAVRRLLATGMRYPEITVHRLTEEAGISRWRFYQNFHDKHDLLHAWFVDLNREFEQTHDTWLQIDGRSTQAELRDGVRELFVPYEQHSALHAAMYDSAASDPTIRAEVDNTENERIERLRAHIDRGQSEGWIDPQLLPRETAEWIVMTGARGYQRMVSEGAVSPDEFIEAYARYVWHVLYATAPSRGVAA
jgi:AcrR family transcriptional regulator